MVSDIVHRSSVPIGDDDNDALKQHDVVSISSIDEDDDDDGFACNSVALADTNSPDAPTFGNIAVSNSEGIHFGNKTYYQGPVTIKKIVYASADVPNTDVVNNGVSSITNGKCNGNGNDNFACSVDNCAINGDRLEKPEKNVDNFKKITFSNIRKNKPFLITIIICALTIVLIGIVLSVLMRDNSTTKYPTDSDEQDNRTPIESPIDPIDLPPSKLKVIPRQEWLAQPPIEPIDKLITPVPYVIIWHSATDNCTDQSLCTYRVRQIQKFHINSRKWSDIAYNFLVGGDGYIYEGRGWTSEGAHTKFYNKQSIGIAFVGTYTNYLPPKRQIDAAKKLIELGVNESYIQPDYKLFGARQLSSTESPGQLLYEDLIKWPHWSEEP